MRLRKIFKRNEPPTRPEHQYDTPSQSEPAELRSILHHHDELCIIASFLDVPSLLNLRMVDRQVHSSLAEEETWICNGIAQHEYHWVWQSSKDPSFRDPANVPGHLSSFPTLKSVIRLHLATLLPMLLLWTTFKSPEGEEGPKLVLPGTRVNAACARGFLTLWKISDIEHEIWETPSPRRPREDYFLLSKVAYPYVRGVPSPVPLEQARADYTIIHRARSRLQGLASWRLHPTDQSRTTKEDAAALREMRRVNNSCRKDPETAGILFQKAQAARRELIATLDQGGWLDLHVVTTLVLAFCVAFAESPVRVDAGVATDKLVLSEWALRQGPDAILGVLSTSSETRVWTHGWIDHQWAARPVNVQGMEELWTSFGPLGISSATTGRYPHPRATEWESAGYPPLDQCTKNLLFRDWETYTLSTDVAARELAKALSDRTGGISFQARV